MHFDEVAELDFDHLVYPLRRTINYGWLEAGRVEMGSPNPARLRELVRVDRSIWTVRSGESWQTAWVPGTTDESGRSEADVVRRARRAYEAQRETYADESDDDEDEPTVVPARMVWVFDGITSQRFVGVGLAESAAVGEGADFWHSGEQGLVGALGVHWFAELADELDRWPLMLGPGRRYVIAVEPADDDLIGRLEDWLAEHAFGAEGPALDADERRRREAEVVLREGQVVFRAELMHAFGGRCAVTGCDVPEALEAAHISPYRGLHTNLVENGVLLRADLHRLLDAGLMRLDEGRVWLTEALRAGHYGALHGAKVNEAWKPRASSAEAHEDAQGRE